ncbi:hypothetical protein [Thorsellia anophelis]|uniref:Uncharacterized protein n=1 Tax=Thorsellia anophelis DSM 18579 TaxID=1123402 RepID=A0A1I0BJA6_9GAMM|nr:hypothetical protein [Thorsellia anophelis]SET07024.1 hypothetical protein SAMN02583745_01282 [Thorsellia anophelis DSM 18579]
MAKVCEVFILMLLMSGIIFIGNFVGYRPPMLPAFIGIMIITAVAAIGYSLSLLPLLKKIPSIIWISGLGMLLSSNISPVSGFIIENISQINILSVSTPVLAYAGLAVGKDLELFKQLSWKIIPVALSVFAGTFIFAAILAHFSLQWHF